MTPFAVERHTKEWVTAGLISPDQARSLEEFEAAHHRPDEAPARVRLGPVAEAGAFIGTVLALIGGGIGVGPQWGDMPLIVQLAISAAIAGVGFVTGTWLMRIVEAGTARLGGFLWVLGTAGVALASGTIVNEIRPDSPWMAVGVGVPTALIGAALWRNLERPLQLITLAIGVSTAVGGVAALLDFAPWHAAAPVWLLGAGGWALTMRTPVHPTVVARALASLALLGGAFMLCDLTVRFGAAAALATAALVIVLALRMHHTLVLVMGVLGALQAVQVLVQSTFRGPAGGAVVALTGLAIVVLIVLRARGTKAGTS
jgi:hypothetical protein